MAQLLTDYTPPADYPDAVPFRMLGGRIRWRKRICFIRDEWHYNDLPGKPGDVLFHERYHGPTDKPPPKPEKPRRWVPASEPERWIDLIVQSARKRSPTKRRDFDITVPWVVGQCEMQGWKCALTGIDFSFEVVHRSLRLYAPSLDRIDCAKGYTKDNVRVVILLMNLALSDFGLDLFDKLAAARIAWKSPS